MPSGNLQRFAVLMHRTVSQAESQTTKTDKSVQLHNFNGTGLGICILFKSVMPGKFPEGRTLTQTAGDRNIHIKKEKRKKRKRNIHIEKEKRQKRQRNIHIEKEKRQKKTKKYTY